MWNQLWRWLEEGCCKPVPGVCAVPNHHSAQRAMSLSQKGQKFLWTLPERMDSHPVPDHLTCSCSLTAELTLVEAAALASTLSGTGVNLSTNTTSLHQPTKTPPFWFYDNQLCWYTRSTILLDTVHPLFFSSCGNLYIQKLGSII